MSIELARKALAANDPDNLKAALKLLKTGGDLSDISPILAHIKSQNKEVAEAAINAVCTIIRSKLVENFNDLPKETRDKLASIMESLDPSIVKVIAADLFSDDRERKVRAVQVLGLLRKNPQIKTLIAKLVTDRDEKVRATAASLLHKFASPDDQEILIALLNDKDMRVRANTVETLEYTANPRMVPILKRFRKVENNRMRGNVLKALYNLGFHEIEDDIVEMLDKSDCFMTASGLWVISQVKISSNKIIDLAAYYLTSDNEMVAINAKKALAAIANPRAAGFLRYCSFNEESTISGRGVPA